MLTDNFNACIKGLLSHSDFVMKSVHNSDWNISYSSGTQYFNPLHADSYKIAMFGSGTTQPTYNDKNIESLVSLSNITIQKTDVTESGKRGIILTITGKNTTGSDVTISEFAYGVEYSSTNAIYAREVITPVTVPNNSTITITYKIMLE